MNVLAYVALTYAATAVISIGVAGVIVVINKIFSSPKEEPADD